jgi:hypothetical protein
VLISPLSPGLPASSSWNALLTRSSTTRPVALSQTTPAHRQQSGASATSTCRRPAWRSSVGRRPSVYGEVLPDK